MGKASNLLIHEVVIASVTGVDSSLAPTYGTQRTIPARVEHRTTTVLDPEGKEALSQDQVMAESEILETDKIWLLSQGDDPTKDSDSRLILSVGNGETTDRYKLFQAFM